MKFLVGTLVTLVAIFVGLFVFFDLYVPSETMPSRAPLPGFIRTSPRPIESPFPTVTPEESIGSTPIKQAVLLNVPFTAQAPFGKWSDQRQEDGCEEASALMAVRWAQHKTLTAQEAEKEIIAISDFEQARYGNYHDTSVRDTVSRIFKQYFNYNNVEVQYNITINDIKRELSKGNLVLVPANGSKLQNPHYQPPGPIHHMLVIRGYDDSNHKFITNDPGTRFGALYSYDQDIVYGAIYDYPTGYHEPINQIIKAMIIVHPEQS